MKNDLSVTTARPATTTATISPWTQNPWDMAGTERTHEYVVVAQSSLGRVGYREYRPGNFRVRVEPTSPEATQKIRETLTRMRGWMQPGDRSENRFSNVVSSQSDLQNVIRETLGVLGISAGSSYELNPAAPTWVSELVKAPTENPPPAPPVEPKSVKKPTHKDLLARAKELGIRGVNPRWGMTILQTRISEAEQKN